MTKKFWQMVFVPMVCCCLTAYVVVSALLACTNSLEGINLWDYLLVLAGICLSCAIWSVYHGYSEKLFEHAGIKVYLLTILLYALLILGGDAFYLYWAERLGTRHFGLPGIEVPFYFVWLPNAVTFATAAMLHLLVAYLYKAKQYTIAYESVQEE